MKQESSVLLLDEEVGKRKSKHDISRVMFYFFPNSFYNNQTQGCGCVLQL